MKKSTPQRKPNKTMSGQQLLNKAILGNYKPKTENQKKHEEIKAILDKSKTK